MIDGVSMELMSKMCATLAYGRYYDRYASYLEHVKKYKRLHVDFQAKEFGAFDDPSGYSGSTSGSKRFAAAYARDCTRRRAISLLYLGTLCADVEYIKIDHTFWVSKLTMLRSEMV